MTADTPLISSHGLGFLETRYGDRLRDLDQGTCTRPLLSTGLGRDVHRRSLLFPATFAVLTYLSPACAVLLAPTRR